ncbi:MAG: hypothetical protein LBV63_04715, partial [Candidatus Methanoplasma sp.]|nr:hypothetical protein [Candidatus Methanoplasma sp.]
MLRPSPEVNSAQQSKMKQRHPGFSVSGGADFNPPGRTAKPIETITSPAFKQLSREGFMVYNVKEKADVYIAIQPDSAYFEEDEPKFIKMEPGSFVSGQKVQQVAEVETRPEPVEIKVAHTQSADIFSNARRRLSFEEIDFNEVIIKSNDNFDEELNAHPLFNPGKGSEELFSSETVPFVKEEVPLAMTSSGATAPAPKEAVIAYSEVNNYSVEVVPAKPVPSPSRDLHSRPIRTLDIKKIIRPPVRTAVRAQPVQDTGDTMFNIASEAVRQKDTVEIPVGLYVEKQAPVNEANFGIGNETDTASFIKMGVDLEPVVTSA